MNIPEGQVLLYPYEVDEMLTEESISSLTLNFGIDLETFKQIFQELFNLRNPYYEDGT